MNESSATERLSRLLRERSVEAHPRADCPDPDHIWLAVRRELPLEGRLAVIDHTTSCAACAEAWRIAKECAADTEAGAIGVDASSSVSAARPPRRAATWWLAAAAVVVLAAGSAYLIRPQGTGDPIFRDPGGRVPASEIAPGTALARESFVLKWTPGPAGAKYNLIVTTENLDVVANVRGIERPEYQLPVTALSGLSSGTRLLWRVVAEAPEGGSAASATYTVTLE